MQRITRRTALKSSLAAGAAVWAGTSAGGLRAQSPNSKLNVAFVGLGGQGGSNLKNLSGENVVALCDVDDERAGGAYDRFPQARKFYDYRRMFDEMHQQIDAVVVSTPDHTHFHPSMAALQLGKHLYCEKPMAHSPWEIRQMTDLAAKQGIATQLGVQRHTLDNVHRVVELIKSGAIGEVRECHCWIDGERGMPALPTSFPTVPGHLKWDLWLGPAIARPYSPDYCPYKWRFWWDFGTGEAGNWGCHILDIPYWALGLTHPVRVDASGPTVDAQRTPKSFSSRLVFPAERNRPEVALHWYHASQGPAILGELGLSSRGNNTLFVGSDGMLLCGFGNRKLYPEEKFQGFQAPARSIPDSPGFHREWVSACKGGPRATCDFSYSGPLSESVLLANVAYRAGGGFDWNARQLRATGNDQAEQYIYSEFRKGWQV